MHTQAGKLVTWKKEAIESDNQLWQENNPNQSKVHGQHGRKHIPEWKPVHGEHTDIKIHTLFL